MAAAVDTKNSLGVRGPVVHDGLEVNDVSRAKKSVNDGLVVVVCADEVVETSVEAARVVLESWCWDLGE